MIVRRHAVSPTFMGKKSILSNLCLCFRIKLSKRPISRKPGSIFYFIVPQFYLKLINKIGKFCDQFLAKKLKFLGSFMKPWYWHKMLKLSVWLEKNWNWRHAACQYHGFMKLAKNFNFFAKNWSQNLPFLFVSLQGNFGKI